MRAEGWKWSGHSHVETDSLSTMASDGDVAILKAFGQKRSRIFNNLEMNINEETKINQRKSNKIS